MVKIWVDDIRRPPTGWVWAKTSAHAIHLLDGFKSQVVEVMSLDHDLGGDDTTRPIGLWMCENDFWPVEVKCHSQNPVGRHWIESMIERYKPRINEREDTVFSE